MASLSIAALSSFFAGEQKSITRGENHYRSGHIDKLCYSQGVLRGQVHASMKNKAYKVTVSRTILKLRPLGLVECVESSFGLCHRSQRLFKFKIIGIIGLVCCVKRFSQYLKRNAGIIDRLFRFTGSFKIERQNFQAHEKSKQIRKSI